jgi:hypothetical protein
MSNQNAEVNRFPPLFDSAHANWPNYMFPVIIWLLYFVSRCLQTVHLVLEIHIGQVIMNGLNA